MASKTKNIIENSIGKQHIFFSKSYEKPDWLIQYGTFHYSLYFFLFEYGLRLQKGHHKVPKRESRPITLVIHGGAGTIRKENMTPEREKGYHKALEHALDTGYAVLASGGKSTEAAIKVMEDSPLFNAGKGAALTYSGKNELDASIMDGSSLNAGAVAGVTTIKNPIAAAYAVMLNPIM